jgi:hypothetical protein
MHRLYPQRCRKAARVVAAHLHDIDPPRDPDRAETLEQTRREIEDDDDGDC